MSPEAIVRRYLDAMERRDLAAAKALLASGFFMVFPGNKRVETLAPASLRDQQTAEKEGTLQVLLDAGADVIVPAGGLMLYGSEPCANIDGAPIVNGITIVAKTAEMYVRMRTSVSRRSNFARPPEKALREFLEQE